MAVADSSTRTQAQAQAQPQPRVRPLPAPQTFPAFVVLALVVIGAAGLLPLRLNTNATTTSFSITGLEEERSFWQAKTIQLQNDIATQAALSRIDREAKERFGMIPASGDQQLLITPEKGAQGFDPSLDHVPSRYLPAAPEEIQPSSPWWRSVLDIIPRP